MALRGGNRLLLLKQDVRRTDDAGQRCADIVRHGAQEPGIELFALRLARDGIKLLGAAGEDAGEDADRHHDEKRHRNAREREADMPVRLGKDIVHAQHAEHRVEQAEEKAVCEKRRQKDIEQENHGDVARGLARVEVTQNQADKHRRGIEQERDEKILRRIEQ